MAVVTLQLVGNGSEYDAFRVEMPTYKLLDINYTTRLVRVELPEVDLPPDPVHRAVLTAHSWERAALPAKLHADALAAWHAHLDERYTEHRGRFRPTVV